MSYFKVNSETSFTEIKKLPANKWEINHFDSKNYFDRLYISDLIASKLGYFVPVEENAYLEILAEAELNAH